MARQFEPYSPGVPLGVTWEEAILLEDELGTPIDLTGYSVRAQFYDQPPTRDPTTGAPTTPPAVEIVSAGAYEDPPAWPVITAASIPEPANGTILIRVDVADLWRFAPANSKRKYDWSLLLVNTATQYAIPVVQGRPVFLPAVTL